MTSTAVAKRDEAVKGTLEVLDRPQFQAQLREALPPSVSVERFTRTAKLAVQLNPELIDVQDKQSIFTSLVRCAFDGLIPDGRQAALVKVKERGKEKVAYWPMVGGMRFIAANHGYSLEAHCVYENDEFQVELGFDPKIVHRPPSLDGDRGALIGAYAVATRLADGRKFAEPMWKQQIEEIRAKSPSARFDWSPWNTSTDEMYRKTAAKRLFKQLPLGELEEHETRVLVSDGEVEESTAAVPALANLPEVDPVEEEVEEVEDVEEVEGEVVDE